MTELLCCIPSPARQTLYRSFLDDAEFLESRMKAIAKQAGIGPKKLERCRARGRARSLVTSGVNYAYIYIYLVSSCCLLGPHQLQLRQHPRDLHHRDDGRA